MPITLGNTTISGLATDGLPSGVVTSTTLNNSSVTRPKMGFAGTYLQVVSATKTDTFSASNAGWTGIPGLSVTITPTSTSSTILLSFHINYDSTRSNSGGGFSFSRNGTVIDAAVGAAAGGRYRVSMDFGANANADQSGMHRSFIFRDSPATTSAVTYQVVMFQDYNQFTTFINRTRANGDGQTDDGRFASTITAIEISG